MTKLEENCDPTSIKQTALDSSRKTEIKSEKSDTKAETAPATLSELLQFAEPIDYFLMIIGSIAACLSGFCQPAFCLLFGFALDDLHSGDSISKRINLLCIYL
jgi:hypothetical protein